jgi:enamine deaminase RidA (YjgF/YER057c/UK114 family)
MESHMPGRVAKRLEELKITLPDTPAPAGNYVPAVRSGNLLFIAGQIPVENGQSRFVGKLGREFGIEDGQKAARLCALNILAQTSRALENDLDRVVRCVRVCGFVNATPEFTDQPQVVNGASDLLVAVLGNAGRHARAAVGCSSLPRGVAAEIEAVFEVS